MIIAYEWRGQFTSAAGCECLHVDFETTCAASTSTPAGSP
jgi:hypothetical protein